MVSPRLLLTLFLVVTQIFELQKILRESGDVGLDGDDLIESTDVPNKEQLKLARKRKLETLAGVSA